MELRIHAWLPHSRANGPGVRAVLWTQGCTLGCPGCFNPATHPVTGGTAMEVRAVVERILTLGATVEGVTVSGGEPLQQRAAVTELLRQLRARSALSVVLLTGHTWDEVQRMPDRAASLAGVDVLIAGRYDRQQRRASGWRGSANKTVHLLTDRYTLADLDAVPPAEVVIAPDGTVTISGIDAIQP